MIKPCPVETVAPISSVLLGLHSHYKNGFLPFSGGIWEQSALYYKAMLFIDAEIGRHQKAAEEKARRDKGR